MPGARGAIKILLDYFKVAGIHQVETADVSGRTLNTWIELTGFHARTLFPRSWQAGNPFAPLIY
jgi:hypothetical protein